MELTGAIVVTMRWLHLLATVAFLGSAFFSLVLLAPQAQSGPATELGKWIESRFRELLDVSVTVLLLSGAILTFDRLSNGQASTRYVALLGLKVCLALVIFYLAYGTRRVGLAQSTPTLRVLVAFGALVLLMALLLRGA